MTHGGGGGTQGGREEMQVGRGDTQDGREGTQRQMGSVGRGGRRETHLGSDFLGVKMVHSR